MVMVMVTIIFMMTIMVHDDKTSLVLQAGGCDSVFRATCPWETAGMTNIAMKLMASQVTNDEKSWWLIMIVDHDDCNVALDTNDDDGDLDNDESSNAGNKPGRPCNESCQRRCNKPLRMISQKFIAVFASPELHFR